MVDLDELENLLGGEHCTEWRPCGNDRGGCKCGLIWSTSCDVVVAQVPIDGGDLRWSEREQFHRARLICALRNAAPELLRRLRAAEEVCEAEVAFRATRSAEAAIEATRRRNRALDEWKAVRDGG